MSEIKKILEPYNNKQLSRHITSSSKIYVILWIVIYAPVVWSRAWRLENRRVYYIVYIVVG